MALTADRNTPARDGKEYSYPVAASTKIYAGSLVCLDSSGNAVAGSLTTGLIAVGCANETVDNSSGAAAALNIKVRAGVFRWATSGTLTKASIGDVVYIYDDQTVKTSSTSASPAGVLVDVDTLGAWVLTQPPTAVSSVGLLAANNLSDVGTVATARSSLGLDTGDSPTFTGVTASGNVTVTGNVTSAGNIKGRPLLSVETATYTVGLPAVDGGHIIQDATDNAVITLPDISSSNKGMTICVQNTGADGAAKVSISPHSSDKIKGGVHGAATGDLVSFSGTADKDAINTKATAKQGDYLWLTSDGTDTWWVVGGKGVWASEP